MGRQEEIPSVRGQGQQPGGDTPRPKPEARGGGWEELPNTPKPEAKGGSGEEQPHDRGQGRWPGGPVRPLNHDLPILGGPTRMA